MDIPVINEKKNNVLNSADFTSRYSNVPLVPATKLFKHKTKLFDTISIENVRQGEFEDCFLVSSLAALTEQPNLIRKLFNFTDTYDLNGYYYVRLYYNGMPVVVAVTTKIPVDPKTASEIPLFCKANYNETWAFLAEKAYSILYGGYKNLVGGCCAEALNTLTGFPVAAYPIQHADPVILLAKMQKWKNKKYLMCATCSIDDHEPADSKFVDNHAYTVISVDDTVGSDNFVELRNPWGKSCDNDEFIKISFVDFYNKFIDLAVLRVDPTFESYFFTKACFDKPDKIKLFELKVTSECRIAIGIHQNSHSDKMCGVRACVLNSDCRMSLGGKETFMEMFYVRGGEYKLKPGCYNILIDRETSSIGTENEFSLSLFSTLKCGVSFHQSKNEIYNKKSRFLMPNYQKQFGVCAVCCESLNCDSIRVGGLIIHPECDHCYLCRCPLEVNHIGIKALHIYCDVCFEKIK
ncbi:calpain, putative [Entamoeba invadens IP1]|uniref:Calpain, putative n=1 Tax=Entamoeba invadens IP1 TaxID=370355 RepID=A0A0A1TZL5_ENTIV|nr:calpain, putative [Entamoeba invadens IP1]ELP87040.1 calpain, putative [Entamoeba invadens IP1]|eukprot:XP_004253811.1 calpain, putative [Entamoeba invadens IP1]